MNIEAAVAKALGEDFDIVEAVPSIRNTPVHYLDNIVTLVIESLHKDLVKNITKYGKKYIEAGDHVGMSVMLEKKGVKVPPAMLGKICSNIISSVNTDVRMHKVVPDFSSGSTVIDGNECYPGISVYHVKMSLDISDLGVKI